MCFNSSSSSSSSSSSDVYDERVGAQNGSVATREISGGSITFRDTSEDVAREAIDAVRQNSTDALTASTDFISQAFTQVINASDKTIDRANENVRNTRDFAATIISEEQEGSDERLIQLFQIVAVAGLAGIAIANFENIAGAFK